MDETSGQREPDSHDALPGACLTANQVVAWNMAWFRKAAGLTQEELGELLGWSAAVVSSAERSWDARRIRQFTVDDVVAIATALGIPFAALYMPPEDDGTAVRYLISAGAGGEGEPLTTAGLMRLVFPDTDDDTPVMTAYRDRWNSTTTRLLAGKDPGWARLVTRWLADSTAGRARRADHLRRRRRELLQAADEFGELADAIEEGGTR